MKFIPRNNHVIGRMTIKKSDSNIILVDATKVTKYLLVDAVGPAAAAAGIRVGDLVVVTSLRHIVQDAGRVFIPFSREEDVALFATEVVPAEDLLMQTPKGNEFVAFDDPQAMQSVGAPPREQKSNGAEQYAVEA